MNALKQRIEDAADHRFKVKSEGIGRLGQPTYSAENAGRLENNAQFRPIYIEGILFGFAEAIRMLKNDDAEILDIIHGPQTNTVWARWLQSQIDGEKRG